MLRVDFVVVCFGECVFVFDCCLVCVIYLIMFYVLLWVAVCLMWFCCLHRLNLWLVLGCVLFMFDLR